MEFLVVVWILFGIATAVVWSNKGGSGGAAFVMGLIFGIFALLYAALATPSGASGGGGGGAVKRLKRSCPHCREPMSPDGTVCPHCNRESEPVPLTRGASYDQQLAEVLYTELHRHGPQSVDELARSTGIGVLEVRKATKALISGGAVVESDDGTLVAD